MTEEQEAQYLKTIKSVRERCNLITPKLESNELNNFDVDMNKMDDVALYVSSLIQRDFAGQYDKIPPHGRWQHFEVNGVKRIHELIKEWENNQKIDKNEQCKRLIDLFTVGVLVDAGAGTKWKYIEPTTGESCNRSEGLAVAALDMFKNGLFSSTNEQKVDSKGLTNLSLDEMAKGFQVSEEADNPMQGLEGRYNVLTRLGTALENTEYFPNNRPGDLIDKVINSKNQVDVVQMWDQLMKSLLPIWPEGRTKLNGETLGDAWYCKVVDCIVPFHKLTQWLCYSLIVPMKRVLGVEFINENIQTGLPEYRNGGIFVDLGVLKLKDSVIETEPRINNIPTFTPDSDVIVEWRVATVVLLDILLPKVNSHLGINEKENGAAQLSLAQLLEAGSWKAGRELSKEKRPDTSDPPIQIVSDGTVF